MEWHHGRFQDRVILVTGTSSGIGKAAAERLLAEGATVIGADIAAAPTLESDSGRFIFVHTDVRDDEAAVEAVSTAVEVGGRLDGLVHSAGVSSRHPVHLLEREEWDDVVASNLTGTFVMTKAALAQMLVQDPEDNERGAIVTIGNVTARAGGGIGWPEGASRAGAVLLTRGLALDYGPMGIRANVVCTGVIDSGVADGADPELEPLPDDVAQAHALRRLGLPSEVAATAAFLLSRDASFVTGATIAVDGGYSAGRDFGPVDLLRPSPEA